MFSTSLLIVVAVIAISPLCFAGHADVLRPFLNKQYVLVSSDKNFDKVLRDLDIGWWRRMSFQMAKPKLTLAWDPTGNIYTLIERSLLTKIEIPFQVDYVISNENEYR